MWFTLSKSFYTFASSFWGIPLPPALKTRASPLLLPYRDPPPLSTHHSHHSISSKINCNSQSLAQADSSGEVNLVCVRSSFSEGLMGLRYTELIHHAPREEVSVPLLEWLRLLLPAPHLIQGKHLGVTWQSFLVLNSHRGMTIDPLQPTSSHWFHCPSLMSVRTQSCDGPTSLHLIPPACH